jgi:hypothetical protein
MTILRLFFVLSGIVLMINGCNGLLSQFFGTHKLRTLSAETALREGVGDADYVALTDSYRNGKFVVGPALHAKDKDILLYPLLSTAQHDSLQRGQAITAGIVAWGTNYDPPCITRNDCIPAGNLRATGLIREPNPQKNTAFALTNDQIRLREQPIFMEIDRQPLAWYWNLLMFAGGIGLAFSVEAYATKRRQALRESAFIDPDAQSNS